MAQFLIKRRQHWAELAQPPEWSDRKWAGRPMRGDIVEVRENGFWRIEYLGTGVRHWNREAFALVQVTNLSLQQVAAFQGSYSDETRSFKNRWQLPNWSTLPWEVHTVTVNGAPEEEWYYIRANIHAIVTPVDKAAT